MWQCNNCKKYFDCTGTAFKKKSVCVQCYHLLNKPNWLKRIVLGLVERFLK